MREDFLSLKMQAVESIQAEFSVSAPLGLLDLDLAGRRAGFRPDDCLDDGRGQGPSLKTLVACRERSEVRRQTQP